MKTALIILVLLSATFTEASAQTSTYTTESRFEIGKFGVSAEMEREILARCPEFQNENWVVVQGHHDKREYPKNSSALNYYLTIDRSGAIALLLSSGCNIPDEHLFIRGQWNAGDPKDLAGNESRTVTIMSGFGPGEFEASQTDYDARLAEMQANLERIRAVVESTHELAGEAVDMARQARDASNRAAEASERAARASERTENAVRNRFGNFFVRVGDRVNSDIGHGATVAIGSGVSEHVEIYGEGYAEWTSHDAFLLERPDPINEILHWGSWYSTHLILRYYISDHKKRGATFFAEGGAGFSHVEYEGPAESIGWKHTGFSAILRGGLQIRRGPFGAEFYVGENFSHFPKNRVDAKLATGKFAIAVHTGARITLYL